MNSVDFDKRLNEIVDELVDKVDPAFSKMKSDIEEVIQQAKEAELDDSEMSGPIISTGTRLKELFQKIQEKMK